MSLLDRLRRGGVRSAVLVLLPLASGCGARGGAGLEQVPCRTTVAADGSEAPATRWILPADTADRRTLDAWCAAVGPAVHVPLPEETRPTAPEPDALEPTAPEPLGPEPVGPEPVAVVVWNVAIGAGDLPRLVRDLRRGRLTEGRPIHRFVLLLQEAHRAGGDVPPADRLPDEADGGGLRRPEPPTGPRTDVVTVAREAGLALHYVPSMRNGFEDPGGVPEDRGNAVLSSLPLSGFRAIELPPEIQRRVAVEARVRLAEGAGAELAVVSVHLDNAALSRPLASFGSLRAHQAQALVAALPEQGPLALGGDLNTWWRETDEAAVRILRRAFPGSEGHEPRPTATRLGRDRVLDYLFFRGTEGWRMEYRRVDDRYGSDHNPLLGWVLPPG